MEYFGNDLCVTFKELTGGECPIITPAALLKNVQRKKIACARQGKGDGRYALYVHASLPAKYRKAFEAKYGRPEDLVKQERMREEVKEDADARSFYAEYEYCSNGVQTRLPERLIDEYTTNASVLGHLWRKLNETRATRHALGSSRRGDLWSMSLERSEALRESTGHTLPGSEARLKLRMKAYKEEGYASLLSGKLGNRNTLKITEEGGRRLIALRRSRVPVLTVAQILKTYNAEASGKGWKPIKSERSLQAWYDSPMVKPLWYDAVHGELASHQKFDRKHRTELPTRRDSLWYGDGTKLNLYYRDEQGKTRTAYVYEVIDAATETMLGFHICDTENFHAQYMAYRMAVQVSGHKPYEIVYDNQGGHTKEEAQKFFSRISRVHRATAPYNGSSKTIESLFGRFQSQVLHKDWRFTGMNVTAKKSSSKPNVEFVDENRKKLYTLLELKAAYADARREWNAMPHPATGVPREEMYRMSVNPDTDAVTPLMMVDMFWIEADRMSTFTPSGIEITVNKQKYAYEVYSAPGVPDTEWRMKHTWEQFAVKYDPYDFSSIRLYRKDKAGELRFERIAEPYMVIHRALQDQTEGEMAFIRQQQEATEQARIERQVVSREIEYAEGVAPEQHGLETPRLKGVRKEVQEQIDRRTRKYIREPEELSIGRVTKSESNMDWLDVLRLEGNQKDMRRTAGKI